MTRAISSSIRAASVLTLLIAFSCNAWARGEWLRDFSLDEVIAVANGAPTALGLIDAQYDAIDRLGHWAAAPRDDEAKIAAALGELLKSNNPSVRRAAAGQLGHRAHAEFVPQLAEMLQTDAEPFLQFYLAASDACVPPPPDALLRAVLCSEPWQARGRAAVITARYKRDALREDVERLAESDAAQSVREDAASALADIGTRESIPALRRAVERYPDNEGVFRALGRLGGDREVPLLLGLLKRNEPRVRERVLRAFGIIKVTDAKPMLNGLVSMLEQDPGSLVAATILARYHDPRALPFLRRMVESQRRWQFMEDETCVRAIADVGGPAAVALLNEMVAKGWWRRQAYIERQLEKLGDSSSAEVVWAAYLQNPIRRVVSGWCMTTAGYREGFPVLIAFADRDLLQKIRTRASETGDCTEERALSHLIKAIEERQAIKAQSGTT